MRISPINVERTVQDLSVSVKLDEIGTELTMCGELIDGDLKKDSVAPVFFQKDLFESLDEKVQHKIVLAVTEKFSANLKMEDNQPIFKPDGLDGIFEKLAKRLVGTKQA